MPSSCPRGSFRRAALMALALLAPFGAGCHRESPEQLNVVQAMAEVLGKRNPQRLALACALVVPEHQDPLSCDNLIVPMLHYAPGFPGSKVTRRGPARWGLFGKPWTLPVHYEGQNGSGNLDVTMRFEKKTRVWRIYSLLPVP